MGQIDEQTLKTQLKNKTLSNVYLLTGEEELTKKRRPRHCGTGCGKGRAKL